MLFEGLALALLLFFLSLLLFLLLLSAVSRFIPSRDKDLLLFGSALTLGATTTTSMFAPALPGWLYLLPGGGLGALVWIRWCRRRRTLGLGLLVPAGVHLSSRQGLCQSTRGKRVFRQRCCSVVSERGSSHPRWIQKLHSSKPLWLWLHLLSCLYNYSSGG